MSLSRTAILRALAVVVAVWAIIALAPLDWSEASNLLQSTDTPTTTPTPTRTPTATPFMEDLYEPNNTFDTAAAVSVNFTVSYISFYPSGDVDYFKFWGKIGRTYEVRTVMVDGGLDSYMRVFGPAGAGQLIGENDDATAGDLGSLVKFTTSQDGFYFVELTNRDPTDPIGKTYQLKVTEVAGTPTSTPAASSTSGPSPIFTPIPGADAFEPNFDFDHAAIVAAGVQYDNLNFVPWAGSDPNQEDNDFFRIWVKPGIHYTCETFHLSPGTDTNMIVYIGPSFEQGVAGNDDRAPGDFSSLVSWYPNYTGWLYLLVGPVWGDIPPTQLAPFTYSLKCLTGPPSTPTPLPTSTPRPYSPGPLPTYTPLPTHTPYPSSTPSPTSFALPATSTPQPVPLSILPLPTLAVAGPVFQVMTVDLLVYYDSNQNLNPELEEGVRDIAVAVYDGVSNELLAFGYTNEGGGLHIGPLTVMGAARVEIPFLGYSRRVTGTAEQIEIRVAPRPLPATVP